MSRIPMKAPKSIRRCVTIPKMLDDKMRQIPDVNWSAVAVLAFQQVVKKYKV